jgi:hypothetical protein
MVRIEVYLLFLLSKETKMDRETIGKWAFIVGLVLAVLAGLLFQPGWAIWVLAILGVVVGFLNVTAEETRGFLLASIALTLSATALNTLPVIGTTLSYILPFVVAFVAGGMIVVALKELFQTARQ